MKAVKIYQAGGPEQLIYQDVPTPDIKDGWSLVKDQRLRHQPFRDFHTRRQIAVCPISAHFGH